jgi:uncharacterized protein (TIGR00369 family)
VLTGECTTPTVRVTHLTPFRPAAAGSVAAVTAPARVPIEAATAELWARTDAVGFLRAWTTGEVPQGPHADHTGNRLVEVPGPGRIVMAWSPGSQLANLSGAVHGGYLALVCDEGAGLAAASTGERFVPMLTLDLDVTYLRPGRVGAQYRVEGAVLHAGRTRVVSECRIVAADGTLITTARGSFVPNARFVESVLAR